MLTTVLTQQFLTGKRTETPLQEALSRLKGHIIEHIPKHILSLKLLKYIRFSVCFKLWECTKKRKPILQATVTPSHCFTACT